MSYSVTGIANLALNRSGVTAWIDNIEGPSFEAQAVKRIWQHCVDDTLTSFRWPFATMRARLTEIETGEESATYAYSWALPEDFLQALEVIQVGYPNPRERDRPEYHIEYWQQQRVLLSNHSDLELIYIGRVEDPNLFDPAFVETLAWRMARELALSLANSPKLSAHAEQRFWLSLDQAKGRVGGQHQAPPVPDPEWITNR